MTEVVPRRDDVCSVCGRSVVGSEDARRVGDRWFCSPSHLLAFEGSRRSRHAESWVGTVVAIAVVAVCAAFVFIWLRHNARSAETANLIQALKQAQAESKQPPRVLFTGRLTHASEVVADDYAFDEYVAGDCSRANRLYDASAGTSGFPPCSGNLSEDATDGRSYLVRGAPTVKRSCTSGIGLGYVFKVSQCYVFTLVGYTNKLSSETIAGKKRATWSYTVTHDEVWVAPEKGHWMVVCETWDDTSTLGVGGRDGRAAAALWSRRIRPR